MRTLLHWMYGVALGLGFILILAMFAGCALAPNTVTPEFTHQSHTLQHEPFSRSPQSCGANLVDLDLHWRLPHNFTLDVSEGYDLNRHYDAAPGYATGSYGDIIGETRE